jgi:hypothetical protein
VFAWFMAIAFSLLLGALAGAAYKDFEAHSWESKCRKAECDYQSASSMMAVYKQQLDQLAVKFAETKFDLEAGSGKATIDQRGYLRWQSNPKLTADGVKIECISQRLCEPLTREESDPCSMQRP